MSPPRLFEPRLVRLRKRRAGAALPGAAFLHARAADDLADRLEEVPRRFRHALALGGAGHMRQALAARPALSSRIDRLTEADWASADVWLEPEHLPFAEGAFDLIVSPLMLHWANDLPGALIQLRRALQPDGLMLTALFGGETLRELRLALLEAESELTGGAGPRVAPFLDVQTLGRLIQRAGFALPATDRDLVTVRYSDPIYLLRELRAMGETAALAERNPRNLSNRILARAFALYAGRFADADGRIRATFEIVTAAGWAPHDSQPQPLKPGSATTRLADALRTQEKSAGEKPDGR